ncbi:hypothetical protein QE152_g3429 [Popillia japonica]|uniref:Uncharacterized protein n=1 Tax=Popillia japonica TaxID=7064 RepID=A0AAW1N2H4_POPJA
MTRKALPFAATYTINGQVLSVAQIKDLGVMFDSRLTFICHLETVCDGQVLSVAQIKDLGVMFDSRLTFICHLETVCAAASKTGKLEYASIIWCPIYNNQIMAVERIQQFLKYLVFKTSGEYPAWNTEYQLLLGAPLTHMSINADNIYSDIFVGAKLN